MAKSKENVEQIISDFFKKLGLDVPIEVKESKDSIDVTISSDDPGLIIGHHGDTLDSLQLILSLIIAKKLGEFKRVTLEASDYKKNRSEYLKNLADQTKERVLEEKKEVYLPNLKPWERRIVHLYFQDDSEVFSESVGEGKDRSLVIKPR